ncbi:transient receptor potential cation channel subfamily A member 1 homolog isoform X2 [Tachypleus tridentatus]
MEDEENESMSEDLIKVMFNDEDTDNQTKKNDRKVSCADAFHMVIELGHLAKESGAGKLDTTQELHLTLHQVARNGDDKLMQILLGNIPEDLVLSKICESDEDLLTPLHYAARYNNIDVVKLLVEKGADVNFQGEDGLVPLHFAARYKKSAKRESAYTPHDSEDTKDSASPSVIEILESAGANVNAKDKYGMTALHYAAMRGNELAARELLNCSEINTEVYDKQEMTPLHFAAIYGNTEIANLLLDAGAEMEVFDEDLSTPLHKAAMEGHLAIVKLFLSTAESKGSLEEMISHRDEERNMPLHWAVERGHTEIVKLLLEKGAKVNVPRVNFVYPLHLAAISGNLEIVKMLVEHNARINCLNTNQSTPLHQAAAFNQVEIIEYLLENKAIMECRDKEHLTPLLIAASKGHENAVIVLLEHYANIGVVDKNDRTAVYWAAKENNLAALKILLKHPLGRQLIDRSDRYDNSPLHVAAQNGYLAIFKLLVEFGSDISNKNEDEETPLHVAAKDGRTNIVRAILAEDKTLVNDEDEGSNTPLHIAAIAGHDKVIKLLLNAGANVEARNCYMWTPLDCAASCGWVKTTKILLKAGCPVDPMDKTKTTPLHLAAEKGHAEVVKLLLSWGANISQKDNNGNNCLDLAIDHRHSNVAQTILEGDNWEMALRNETDANKFGIRQTPLRKLIAHMPSVAEFVFNKCVKTNGFSPEHPELSKTFNYQYLDDIFEVYKNGHDFSTYDDDGSVKEDAQVYTTDAKILQNNHPLMIMVRMKQQTLLGHPLCTSLVNYKWKRYGRYVYYGDLFIYLIFLTFLTGYVLTTPPPCPEEMIHESSHCCLGNHTCHPPMGPCDNNFSNFTQTLFARIGKFIIYIMAIIHLFKEVFQMYEKRHAYFTVENLIEWCCYISALLFVFDFTSCSQTTGIRLVWQWQLGALSVFLAWMILVLFIRKFPVLGIYVNMFTDILRTFSKFFIVFFFFIVAFAFGFYALLQNQDPFENIGESILKTSVMMIGELEFDSIFNDDENPVHFKPPTYILFVIFLILMSIIIMNLLVGLAVDDIKSVQEHAVLARLAMQVDLVLNVENILPGIFRRHCIRQKSTIYPNAWKTKNRFVRMFMFYRESNSYLEPPKTAVMKIEEQQESISKKLSYMQEELQQLRKQNNRLQHLLMTVVENSGIEWHDEDQFNI